MSGTKRTHSFAFPGEKESKLSKRKSSIRVSALAPLDAGSPTPPALRRASTLTVDDDASPSDMKTLKSKRSSTKPASLTKKSSSFVEEGVLVTRLSGLRSGSVVGETCASDAKKKSKTSLSKTESIRVTAVDETELTSAVSRLKSHMSKEGSKSSLVSVPSLSALKKLSSVKSSAGKGSSADDNADDMDTTEASTSASRADTAPLPPGGLLELAISFDTTGSMYGCLEEVRAKVQDLVQRLQADIPGIRIAVIAHGDYCDVDNYIVKWVDFGASVPEICNFVKTVSRTGGGDGPECYELVLQRAREVLTWTPGSQRVLIMIGDNEPHPVGYQYGGKTYNIDWREECALLKDMNVKIYAVQAGSCADDFNKEMARITGGCRLNLKTFSSMFDFLMMICYREANPEMLAIYQQEILDREGRIADDVNAMTKTFGVISKGAPAKKPVAAKKAAVAKKPTAAKKAAGAKKTAVVKKTIVAKKAAGRKKATATTAKKGVKALTKTAKALGSKAKTKKSAKKAAKNRKAKKIALTSKVQKREKLNDACMSNGPLKQLTWTKWECAVVPSMPKTKQKSKYSKLRVNNGYAPKEIFDNTFKQRAIYEIAVQLPGKRSTRKYPMYMLSKFGFRRVMHWATHLLRHKKIRVEVNNILSQGCSIYVRRGVLSSKLTDHAQKLQLKPIEKYIRHNYDYAWNKYIWRRTPLALTLKSFTLQHRQVNIRRGGITYKLSNKTV